MTNANDKMPKNKFPDEMTTNPYILFSPTALLLPNVRGEKTRKHLYRDSSGESEKLLVVRRRLQANRSVKGEREVARNTKLILGETLMNTRRQTRGEEKGEIPRKRDRSRKRGDTQTFGK